MSEAELLNYTKEFFLQLVLKKVDPPDYFKGEKRENFEQMLKSGIWSKEILSAFLANKKGEGIAAHFCEKLIAKMENANLVTGFDAGYYGRLLQSDFPKLFQTFFWGKIEALYFGDKAILDFAEKNVFKIVVKSKDGDESVGTGFICQVNIKNKNKLYFITNEHVVDPNQYDIHSITNNCYIIKKRDFVIIDDDDLAYIELSEDDIDSKTENTEDFNPINTWQSESEILSRIITFGYPRVANTMEIVPLAHSGELNAKTKLIYGEKDRYIISADVAPGNSGSPVLNQFASVIGIVTESLEDIAVSEKVVSTHHSAIPIMTFIKNLEV